LDFIQSGFFAFYGKFFFISCRPLCQNRFLDLSSYVKGTNIHPPFADAKGGENMRPQSHEEHIRHTFDSFCKKILKYKARDYYRKMKRRGEHEVSFSELSEQDLAKLSGTDEYFKDAYSFHVLGHDITVSDEQIAEALNALPADRRDIILLSYFLDMTDKEIAESLNLVRRTVAYRRTSSLQELKKFMKGNAYE
jgi:RNA polymerase sigma factor (sigma-70 family)